MKEIEAIEKAYLPKEETMRIIRSIMGDSKYTVKETSASTGRWYIEITYTDYKTEYQLNKLLQEALPGCQIELERSISEEMSKKLMWEFYEQDKVFSAFDTEGRPVRLRMLDVFYAMANRVDLSGR